MLGQQCDTCRFSSALLDRLVAGVLKGRVMSCSIDLSTDQIILQMQWVDHPDIAVVSQAPLCLLVLVQVALHFSTEHF
jgi:hypothetical protein